MSEGRRAQAWLYRLGAGRGRAAALVVLALFLAAQLGAGERLFAAPRLALFDSYQRLLPRIRRSAPVVIVAVDEHSLARLGQWPWPRTIVARLVQAITAAHPAALGVDMLWPEADATSPPVWVQAQGALPADLRKALDGLPDHDALLRAALASGPVALGFAGERDGTPDQPGPLAPVRVVGAEPSALLSMLPAFGSAVRSLPLLDRAAAGHGLLSVDRDRDGLVRRMPLVSVVNGQPAPSLGMEMLRLATGAPWIDLYLARGKAQGVAVGELAIPSQANGSVWIDYSPDDPRRFVSAADVLDGQVPATTFDQRLVLLGIDAAGLVDHAITPLGPMPGVEVHAEFLENAFDRRFAVRPRWSPLAEAGLTATLGLLLIAGLPLLRLRWYAPAGMAALALLTAAGVAAWVRARWLIDVAAPAFGDAGVLVALLGGGLAEADRQRRRLRRELELRKLEAARIEGELGAAVRIQMGMLPKPSALAPDARFTLDAAIVPARQVGGDFYDFFLVGPRHLFVAIGDVSGKGVSASLFMAIGKSLCKSCALRESGVPDIGAVVRQANAEIGRDNVEMLFITLFAGILDLASGRLAYCNAGHDAPFLLRGGAAPVRLPAGGGPPLCALDDFDYPAQELQLVPGDRLCLVTDGVTEAMNRSGGLLGHERIAAALASVPPAAGAGAVVAQVRGTVAAFVDGAEPSDDLTVLALQWLGAKADDGRG